MNREEMAFRGRLRAWLLGAWLPSWHEPTAGSSVGVPDCSFIMRSNCETGWAELKVTKRGQIGIEPTQHQWIAPRVDLIPMFFFIEHECDEIIVVDARFHRALVGQKIDAIRDLAEGREYKYATCRDRMVADLIELTKRQV